MAAAVTMCVVVAGMPMMPVFAEKWSDMTGASATLTPIPVPTETPTPVPTETPTPIPTETPAPTYAPENIPTPVPTETPIMTPELTPAPETSDTTAATGEAPIAEPSGTPTDTPAITPEVPEPSDTGYNDDDTLKLYFTCESVSNLTCMFDGDIETSTAFTSGTRLKVSSDNEIRALYIKWDAAKRPGEWKLISDKEKIGGGKEGFLHEYIEIRPNTYDLEIEFLNDSAVCEIYGIGDREPGIEIQKWEKTPDKADILLFVPHAGDELIDYGALIASYSDEYAIQVVYMCEYDTTDEKVKEHEKLDALWKLGVRSYPINGTFRNKVLKNYSLANAFYGKEKLTEFATLCIRRFKPQVVVGPDIEGEYGNSVHTLFAEAIVEAVDNSGDPEFFSESAQNFSTWTAKKIYFHWLISTEDGTMLFNVYEEGFGGTLQGFLKNVQDAVNSSTWCGSFLEGSDYSLEGSARFGLYRSNGAAVVANDMVAEIVSYGEQERIQNEEKAKALEIWETELSVIASNGKRFFGRFLPLDK